MRLQAAQGDELPGEAQAVLRVEEDVVQLFLGRIRQWQACHCTLSSKPTHDVIKPSVAEAFQIAAAAQAVEDIGVKQYLIGLFRGLRVRPELQEQLSDAARELSDIVSQTTQPRCDQELLRPLTSSSSSGFFKAKPRMRGRTPRGCSRAGPPPWGFGARPARTTLSSH